MKILVRLEVAGTSLRGHEVREKSRDFQAIIVVIISIFLNIQRGEISHLILLDDTPRVAAGCSIMSNWTFDGT
jgi:hypothetical protein